MVKIRTLVPLTHPKTGEVFAAGAEVDVAEDVFNDWRADGKVLSIADEKAQADKLAKEGVYDARTSREDTASTKAEEKPAPKEKK